MIRPMDRDPGDFPAYRTPKAVADMSEDEFTAWLEALPPAPGIRHIDDVDPEDDARAMADFRAGRFYDHATVGRWLLTVGKPGFVRFEDWLAKQDG